MLSGVSWGHSGETGHTQMVMGKDSQQTQRIQHDALHGTDTRGSQLLQHDVALQRIHQGGEATTLPKTKPVFRWAHEKW